MPPCAWIVGSPGVGKFSLAKALGAQPAAKTDCNEYSLTLDTKYYTADVLLRCAAPRPSAPGSLEALVLVFDASDRSSFDNIRSWADQQDTEAVEVKLLVANKVDLQQREPGPRAPWLDDAAAWCCNAGYEFIEAAAGRPSLDAQLEAAGEQQGAARVLAALQAHMWPGLVQKPWRPAGTQQLPLGSRGAASSKLPGSSSSSSSSQRDQGQQVPAVGLAGAAAAGGAADSDVLQQRASPAPLEAAAAAQQQAAQAAVEPSHTTQLQEQQQQRQAGLAVSSSGGHGAAAAAANGTAATSAATGSSSDVQKPAGQHQQQQQPAAAGEAAEAAVAGDGGSGSDQEPHGLALDEFEQLMKQVAGMRGRLSGLPDAERRAAAADMALRLAAAMGLDGGDSDDEDEDDDDDEDDAAASRD